MPNGRLRPSAKTPLDWILPSAPGRSTRMRLALLSATNRSPLGAVTILRGLVNPSASRSAWKPAGTLGEAPWGRGTCLGPLSMDLVAPGAGRPTGVGG